MCRGGGARCVNLADTFKPAAAACAASLGRGAACAAREDERVHIRNRGKRGKVRLRVHVQVRSRNPSLTPLSLESAVSALSRSTGLRPLRRRVKRATHSGLPAAARQVKQHHAHAFRCTVGVRPMSPSRSQVRCVASGDGEHGHKCECGCHTQQCDTRVCRESSDSPTAT